MRRAGVRMQRRLLRSFIAGSVAVVVGFGLPLGVVTTTLIRRDAVRQLQREADALELALRARAAGGDVPAGALQAFISPSSQVRVVDPEGIVVVRIGPPDVGSGPLVAETRTGDGMTITVAADGGATRDRQREVWLAIAALGAVAVAVAAVSATFFSRRLARPMRDLAGAAERLGRGEFPVHVPASGPDELVEIGRQLRLGSEQLADLLARERNFSANASHQLRSALTALRLRLDEVDAEACEPGVRHALAHVNRQVDRLDATVEDLLRLARGTDAGTGAGARYRVGPVVEEGTEAWAPAFRAERRRLEVRSDADAEARGNPRTLRQVLDVLLDNALRHGDGTTHVVLRTSLGGPVVSVRDEGPGILPGFEHTIFERGVTGSGGSGIGLALARQLVEAEGGRLVLTAARPAALDVYLAAAGPSTPPREAAGP